MQSLTCAEPVVDKWGYAILSGVIGMAAASEPGGISANAGFAVGFFGAFLGLVWLEVRVQKMRLKRLTKLDQRVIVEQAGGGKYEPTAPC